MNLIRKYFLTIVILGLINKVYSQENNGPLRLSITEAQEYALQNNRAVQAAKIDNEIATKQVKETVAMGLPQFNLASNYQHQFVIPELSFGPYLDVDALPDEGYLTKNDVTNAFKEAPPVPLGVKDNTTFDFTLSQLIFSGEYIVGLHAAKIFKQVSEKTVIKTEDITKESVASTYYLIQVLGESVKVLKESLIPIDRTYNEQVKMNEQGFNEDTDVDQIKISRSNLIRLITAIESQKLISEKLLKYQLGMDFSQPVVLTDSIPGFIMEGNLQYLNSPVYNVSKSIDYKILTDRVSISSLLVKRAQSTWLPTVTGFYRRHEQTNQPAFNFAVKDLVGLSLNFPIFTSGQRSASISKAKFNLDKSTLDKYNAEQGLVLEFETALSTYQKAYRNFTTNSETIVLCKKIYEKSIIKFNEGVSSSFELSQNQSQFLTAESNYYTSVLNLLNAKAKLDRILSTY
jgi:outer membrane protein TolC